MKGTKVYRYRVLHPSGVLYHERYPVIKSGKYMWEVGFMSKKKTTALKKFNKVYGDMNPKNLIQHKLVKTEKGWGMAVLTPIKASSPYIME